MLPTFPLNIITNAMMRIGAISQGEAPSAGDAQFCLEELNSMLDQWATKNLYVYAYTFFHGLLIPNLAPHTIGPAGTPTPTYIVPQRPVKIMNASIILNNVSPPVNSPLAIRDDQWWADQPVQGLASNLPTDLYYNPTWPAGQLNFWPIPQIAYGVQLEIWGLLPQFTGLAGASNSFNLPPGYRDAIQMSLAERLCPSFQKPLSVEIATQASQARLAIGGPNNQPRRISTRDVGVPHGSRRRPTFNWLIGQDRP